MQPDKEKDSQPGNNETREILLGEVKASELDEKLMDIELSKTDGAETADESRKDSEEAK